MEPLIDFLPCGILGKLIVIVLSIAAIAAVVAYIRFRILPWVSRRRG